MPDMCPDICTCPDGHSDPLAIAWEKVKEEQKADGIILDTFVPADEAEAYKKAREYVESLCEEAEVRDNPFALDEDFPLSSLPLETVEPFDPLQRERDLNNHLHELNNRLYDENADLRRRLREAEEEARVYWRKVESLLAFQNNHRHCEGDEREWD